MFEALVRLRRQLEPDGLMIAVQGARRDTYPSGMARDMGQCRLLRRSPLSGSGAPASAAVRTCLFCPDCRDNPAARPMIVEIPQRICCGISTKTKIRAIMPRPPRERRSSPPPSPRTALTRTAHH
jgi:hypothetical protein